jgi:AcrR family transcriptional regulator
MPKNVDHNERRREIVAAANEVIAEVGLRGLTFRAVADKLGGSTTVVTHYYASQRELLEGFATSLVETWEGEIDELERHTSDPYARLMLLLEWLIPLTRKGKSEERARINLLAERNLSADVCVIFWTWEEKMRDQLREHIRDLVPETMIETRVDSLRVLTNGLTLSAIEHPNRWPRKRLLAVLRQALSDMGLLAPTSTVDATVTAAD